MGKKLKVGIIGVGGIAGTHIPGWQASEDAELVAGSDISAKVLAEWGAKNGVKRLVTDSAELFSDRDIDIIDICTPSMYHAPLAIAALRAGKHVICEKPLAPTPKDIRDMIAARDASGKQLMTAQHFRFSGTSRALKTEIDGGVLGDVYHARGWMLRRAGLLTRPGFIMKKHAGGGACIDIGVHILDLTLLMMGNPKPVAVSGVARTELAKIPGAFTRWSGPIPKEFDVEEFAAGFVRFENGATLMLEVSWLLHHDVEGDDTQMWLYGNGGGSHWPSCQIFRSNYKTRQQYNTTLKIKNDLLEPHAQECVEFARAVASGAPSPVPAEESLQVISILDGIYRSQKTGREILLKI